MRILNLLAEGPLCGCFLQEIVGICQVKVSKQLAYLKKMRLVESGRNANWVVYMLAEPVHPVLAENVRLMRGEDSHPELLEDLKKRREILERVASGEKATPQTVRTKCCQCGQREHY